VYQVGLTPHSCATSSRRSPGVRRRGPGRQADGLRRQPFAVRADEFAERAGGRRVERRGGGGGRLVHAETAETTKKGAGCAAKIGPEIRQV